MMLIISASRAHNQYLVLQSSNDLITSPPAPLSPSLKTVLERLCSLFALSTIINPRSPDALYLIESNGWGEAYLNTSQFDTVRFLVNELLEQSRPEAIALTDAWGFSDASLCSTLDMRDGNAYENIMRRIEQMPINKRSVEDSWVERVDPILKGEGKEKAKL
jgi:acyl-CoA oxidase